MKQNVKLIKNIGVVLILMIISAMIAPTLFKSLNFGLDLQGGFEVLYQVKSIDGSKVTTEMVNSTYKTIQKRIRRLVELEKMEKDGTFDLLPKKEVILLKKEAAKLEKNLGGIKEMRRLPSALFVVDPKAEHNAVAEARILGIPVFGIVDTNCDPDEVDYVIPANDDAIRAVKLIVAAMADAICEAKSEPLTVAYVKDEDEKEVTMNDAVSSVENNNRRGPRNKAGRPAQRRESRPTQE